MIYRQGDVLLVKSEAEKVSGEKMKMKDRVILAFGESSGHAHAFYDKGAALYDGQQSNRHLKLVKTVALRHEEHSPIEIPPGIYDLPSQVEWTDQDEPRPVID